MLLILFACEHNSLLKITEPTVEIAPMEAYAELQSNIDKSFELWQQENSDQAQQLLTQIYQEDFKIWHDKITKEDPMSSMELELQFGKALAAMSKNQSKNAVEMQRTILQIMKREMSELPYTPPEVKDPQAESETIVPSDGTLAE